MICKIAGISEVVRGFKNNPKTRRKEVVEGPKYEFVTSHIMRRSFASNYYGKIETPLLMNITGHTKESTFLTYIGTHQNKDALADLFMEKAGVIW
jgi:integrase